MLRKKPEFGSAGDWRQGGFTLAELLVSMVVLVQILLIALLMFDFNSRVTRVQTNLAEMQQSLRVGQQELVRMTRMTGRSGLPVTNPIAPVGGPTPAARLAVQVINNVTGDTRKVVPGEATTPLALEGSDILVLRGNFSSPLFSVTLLGVDDRANPTQGQILVRRVDPDHPEQDLSALTEAENGEIPEALILLPSTPGVAFAVLELVPSTTGDTADEITLDFRVRGTDAADAYHALWTNDPDNTAFPMIDGAPGYAAILEEYRFYVINDGGDAAETARPRLARARLLPGTDLAYGDPTAPDPLAASLRTDIADNILDLQVALGFDTDIDGDVIGPDGLGTIFENIAGSGVDDDWLYNSADDDATDTPFLVADRADAPRLYFVRVTTLARSARPERTDEEPILNALEDHTYPADGLVNSTNGRKYRRSFLQTTVDLRNL
ncbi:MAG: PilW family protein [Acidobacteria bacterium]|nr:PilW family protein [Acidobacteriota bacterium]